MAIEHINPEGMLKSPAYSQGIVVPVGLRTLLIGGQNGVDEKGQLVSKDFGEQSARAIDNVIRVLETAGGTLDQLVRLAIYIKGDVNIRPGFEAWMKRWGDRSNPPIITVLRVAGLGMSPEVLIEIEATAVLEPNN
jgi:enamine deaminase RidA (YjgF/YER057c/UK114 family)